MTDYEIRALSSETWDAFAELVERHNGGGFGGCWCTWFHRATHSAPGSKTAIHGPTYTRDYKRELVETGRSHAALVFAGETAVAWAQFGPPEELPGISHRKDLENDREQSDWRVTCVFVDRKHRGKGIARIAVEGALELIAQAGGGTVESYPQDTAGKKISASFLYNATLSTFTDTGFSYEKPKGKNHCIVCTTVPGRACEA